VDKNQDASASILPNAHPPFLIFAVLLVKDGDSQWVQKDLRRAIKAHPVFFQAFLGFDRIPLESVAQYSPADCNKQCPLCRILWHSTTILAIAPIFKPAGGKHTKSVPNCSLLENDPPQPAATLTVRPHNRKNGPSRADPRITLLPETDPLAKIFSPLNQEAR